MKAPHHRLIFVGVVLLLWIAAVVVKGVVRPSLDSDVSSMMRLLLNSAPSLVGGLTVPLCFLAVHPAPRAADIWRASLWSFGIVMIAELVERASPASTFDWVDVTASLVGVCAAALFARTLLTLVRPRSALRVAASDR